MFINAVLLFYVCLVCESMKLFMKYVSKQLTNSKIHFFHTKLSYWLYGLEAAAEKRDLPGHPTNHHFLIKFFLSDLK